MIPLTLSAWCAALFLAVDLYPHTVALRLLLLFGGAALGLVALVRAKLSGTASQLRFVPPLLIPFALWAAWAIASLSWSHEPARTLKELKNEVGYTFVALWLGYVAAQARAAPRIVSYVLAVSAVGACVLGLYVFWSGSPGALALRFHSGPGDQSSALLTLMPGALVAAWLAGRRELGKLPRAAVFALPVLFVAAAYATLNRTVWVGFVVQLMLLATLLPRRPSASGSGTNARGRLALGLLVVAIAAAGVSAMFVVQRERFGSHVETTLDHDPRLKLWAAAVGMIEKRPWTGAGFGRGIERHALYRDFDNGLLWHAHNLVLEAAVETGLPGAFLLLTLLAVTGYKGWKLAREPDELAAACGIVLLAVLAGMLIRNMTDDLWVRQNSLLYWGVVGVLLGWGHRRQRAAS